MHGERNIQLTRGLLYFEKNAGSDMKVQGTTLWGYGYFEPDDEVVIIDS